MRFTISTLQVLKDTSTKTFGEVLKKQNVKSGNIGQSSKVEIPAGYHILESKFNKELISLKQFFKDELTNDNLKQKTKTKTKVEVENMLEKYVNFGNNTNNINNQKNNYKNLTPVQRKLLIAAYSKAGKKMNSNDSNNNKISFPNDDKLNRSKLGLLLIRNWKVLEYIAESSGIEITDNKNIENWGFEDELEDDDESIININQNRKNETNNIDVLDYKNPRPQLINSNSNTNFNSMLKDLNKVHQTMAIHVLPQMTSFERQPTIKYLYSNVDIKQSDVENIENFLNNAKNISDNRDEVLFRAETNYEISTQLMSRQIRSLSKKNFFTPIFIPGTLLNINQFGIDSTLQFQKDLLFKDNNFKLKNFENFEVFKIYVDGTSGILTNENQEYWNGDIENIYTIFSKLKEPPNYIVKFKKCLKNGWIPVRSEEREIVMVRDPAKHKIIFIKKSLLIGFIGTLLVSSFYGLTTIGI